MCPPGFIFDAIFRQRMVNYTVFFRIACQITLQPSANLAQNKKPLTDFSISG